MVLHVAANQDVTQRIETALEWYQRKRRRKLNGEQQQQQELPWWASFGASTPSSLSTNPTEEALRILWGGHTGIAPVDTAWQLGVSSMLEQQCLEQNPHYYDSGFDSLPPPPPPTVLLEGPKDCGKTWMLLSLAARFVVATRASAFGGGRTMADGEQQPPTPQVLFLDSNLDFSISKLTHIVRATLWREYSRKEGEREIMSKEAESTGKENYSNTTSSTTATTSNPQTAPMNHLERDVDECLSRIHVSQVHNGMNGWVPVLEVLRQELGKCAQESPTLLLWDGFLADTAGSDSSSTREVLQQMARLFEQQESLWWVLSARTSANGGSRIGNHVTEWWTKHQQKQQQQQNGIGQQQPPAGTIPREFCRVRLDKATMGGNNNPSAFTATVTTVNSSNINSSNNNSSMPQKVPYSVSLQGILS